ncbi:MAG: CxxC-x17-CxxC domain-containing protein [Candidatus Kariarchaeaceae archaeon]
MSYRDNRRSNDRYGNRSREPREMHDAVCADCGEETQVPFVPDPDRPVYCKDCYRKRRPPRDRY